MAAWIYFIHPPRADFAATMTDAERAIWGEHAQWVARLHADGTMIIAGPTGGRTNTGVGIFEAADEAAATAIVEGDPVRRSGVAETELRPFRIAAMRGS